MAFNWNNLFAALAAYFSFKKGQDVDDSVVVPVPPTPIPTPIPKPKPKPVEPPTPPPVEDEIPWTMHYSHYNPISYVDSSNPNGRGVSIILCVDSPRMRSVTLNGTPLRFHAEDRGREIWTNVDWIHKSETRISGTILLTAKDGKKWKIKVTGEGTYMNHRGDCFRVYA